jgi:hypothetical protein
MGSEGVEYVREHFLTTRYLRDYLDIFLQLSRKSAAPEASPMRQAGR